MDNKILTVVIPVYNTENQISRCLDSVINQSYKNIEIIIIDDSSTDNSYSICLRYSKKYKNIKLIRNSTNIGVGLSRNKGIDLANSKYITFLDSDDWLDSNAYFDAISILEREPQCDIAIWGIKTEYNQTYSMSIRYQYSHTNLISNDFALSLLSKSYNQNISLSPLLGSKIFRSSLLKEHSIIFENIYFEDDVFTFLTFLWSHSIALVPETYLHYYQRESSIMHSFSETYIDDLITGFCNLKYYLQTENRFNQVKKSYYSFFKKCTVSMFNILFNIIKNENEQSVYLIYYMNKVLKYFSMEEFVQYIGYELIDMYRKNMK